RELSLQPVLPLARALRRGGLYRASVVTSSARVRSAPLTALGRRVGQARGRVARAQRRRGADGGGGGPGERVRALADHRAARNGQLSTALLDASIAELQSARSSTWTWRRPLRARSSAGA